MILTMQMLNEEKDRLEKEEQRLRDIYSSSPNVKELADRIHNSRMLNGPACGQCIAIAIAKLKSPKEPNL